MCLEYGRKEMSGGRVRDSRCQDSVEPVCSLKSNDGNETSVGKSSCGWSCSHERGDSRR
jgi:hypothetical protein